MFAESYEFPVFLEGRLFAANVHGTVGTTGREIGAFSLNPLLWVAKDGFHYYFNNFDWCINKLQTQMTNPQQKNNHLHNTPISFSLNPGLIEVHLLD